jgi:hypothetical protein
VSKRVHVAEPVTTAAAIVTGSDPELTNVLLQQLAVALYHFQQKGVGASGTGSNSASVSAGASNVTSTANLQTLSSGAVAADGGNGASSAKKFSAVDTWVTQLKVEVSADGRTWSSVGEIPSGLLACQQVVTVPLSLPGAASGGGTGLGADTGADTGAGAGDRQRRGKPSASGGGGSGGGSGGGGRMSASSSLVSLGGAGGGSGGGVGGGSAVGVVGVVGRFIRLTPLQWAWKEGGVVVSSSSSSASARGGGGVGAVGPGLRVTLLAPVADSDVEGGETEGTADGTAGAKEDAVVPTPLVAESLAALAAVVAVLIGAVEFVSRTEEKLKELKQLEVKKVYPFACYSFFHCCCSLCL